MKLWETMERDLNYNTMVSQRGVLNLYHSDAQRDAYARRGNAMRINGIDAELLDAAAVRKMAPFLNFDNARFPIQGGLLQRRGGTARHDAVVWGYAHAADRLGVDIIQNCEVTGFVRDANGKVTGVETSRGTIGAGKVGMAVAGSSSRVAALADLRLPIESHVLQAFVSEGLKPLIPGVMTFGAGHFYVSQSDKGGLVFGGDLDGYNSYAQRGNMPVMEDVCEGGMALMPFIGRVRLLAPVGRHHGHVDGRLADHRQDAGRRALPQRRLVLWRLQGDACFRAGLRPSDRPRRTAQGGGKVQARPLPPGRCDRRKGPRRPTEFALRRARTKCA